MEDSVFIAFQTNDETRPIVDAIAADNPNAVINRMPAMVKIDCPKRLVVKRESIEAQTGREFDLGELTINLVSLSGNIDEDEDEFILHWD